MWGFRVFEGGANYTVDCLTVKWILLQIYLYLVAKKSVLLGNEPSVKSWLQLIWTELADNQFNNFRQIRAIPSGLLLGLGCFLDWFKEVSSNIL